MNNNARYIAFNLLKEIEKNNAYSNLVLSKAFESVSLSAKDKALVSLIFYGVLERKLSLDYIIQSYSNIAINKIEREVLIILRMAFFQLIYTDKIPDSAIVNESVKLSKMTKNFSSSGFINGILRSFIRKGKVFSFPQATDKNKYYELKYSINRDIVKLLENSYGESITKKILNSLFEKTKLNLRTNTLKTDTKSLKAELEKEGLNVRECKVDNALILDSFSGIKNNVLFKEGFFHIQSIPSQICAMTLGAKEGNTVFDVCSAPGGKAFTVAQIMKNLGTIYAFDIHEHKIKLIDSGAKRLGINIIKAYKEDSRSADFSKYGMADCVLCDVPCSGLGDIRRKPEIKYKDVSNLKNLYKTQYNILSNSAKVVKRGGTLIYSTCTLNIEENNKIADKFLSEHRDFVAKEITLPTSIERNSFEDKNQLTIFPFDESCDGFFISAFKKR